MKESHPTLHQALQHLQASHVPIRLTARSIALWSPNTRVSSSIRNVIKEHKAEVRQMVLDCKVEVPLRSL